MKNWLLAKEGHIYLPPRLVIVRLENEFAYVESIDQEGQQHVAELIKQLPRNKKWGGNAVDGNYLDHLRKVQNDATFIYFGDDAGPEDAILSIALVPGTPLAVDFSSPKHQQATRPLLERCAHVLGYDIVEEEALSRVKWLYKYLFINQ
jgi:hypothetical protein